MLVWGFARLWPLHVGVACSLFAGLAGPAYALDNRLSVVTSYPEELTAKFEDAFEKLHPEVDLVIVWKQGRDAYGVLSKQGQDGMDVYWSPSLETFPKLKEQDAFQQLKVDRAVLPGKLGQQVLSDADGYYEGFEVAGYAIALNTDVAAKLNLPEPKTWEDLAAPVFAGQVSMPQAGKVGFSPAMYDLILQSEGWVKGWAALSEISGNAEFGMSGAAPTDALKDGKAAALTIDFFPLGAAAKGEPVKTIYPRGTSFLPANVAILKTSQHKEAAQAFVDFVLSKDGQKLLLTDDVQRYPVRPDAYEGAPAGTVNPFAMADKIFPYDINLGRQRRDLDVALFSTLIVDHHAELVALWQAVHASEAKLISSPDDAMKAKIEKARSLLSSVPVTEAQSVDKEFFASVQDEANAKNLARQWQAQVKGNIAEAQTLLGLPVTAQ